MVSLAILQTGSVGWLYWGLPLLALMIEKTKNSLLVLFVSWQIFTIIFYQYETNFLRVRLFDTYSWNSNNLFSSLFFTLMLVSGIFLLYSIIMELQEIEDPYRFKKKPISIAIAGDSGVGKDRLSYSLSSVVGQQSCTILLGDDYHIAERGDNIWKKLTHLNPKTNNLLQLNADFNKSLNRMKY
jgi:hypothetical protein